MGRTLVIRAPTTIASGPAPALVQRVDPLVHCVTRGSPKGTFGTCDGSHAWPMLSETAAEVTEETER